MSCVVAITKSQMAIVFSFLLCSGTAKEAMPSTLVPNSVMEFPDSMKRGHVAMGGKEVTAWLQRPFGLPLNVRDGVANVSTNGEGRSAL
ncbi:TMV resistance protein N-like [Pyrus ussuriensis x Pyrus communis]|uniref:TMV resistance protein N-like n=1 Tax=Pyrus ussuriensis x Pyrus communis TaxID=2448454 RepID=A0A5N5HBK5_9ROSA|nr:TMV resistance protein N-like [Pyrus ussuriensis x Pyrus communis]